MKNSEDRKSPVIALLTDFGPMDTYIGSLKASIYSVIRDIPIIDLCHSVRPQNILHAAFILRTAYRDYPGGTIFVCIVDPGVGTRRLPIAVQAGPYYFIGPDNGIFSYIYRKEQVLNIVKITNANLWRHPISPTFHGRDIFAPTAAHLAKTGAIDQLGAQHEEYPHKLEIPLPKIVDSTLTGKVMHIDRFGNLITNIHHQDYLDAIGNKKSEINISDWTIPFGETYATVEKKSLVGLWGSSQFLEISARNTSACDILDCELGDTVSINIINENASKIL